MNQTNPLNLKTGQYVKINRKSDYENLNGSLMEFVSFGYNGYTFANSYTNKKVTVSNASEFTVLPDKNTIKRLIDITLDEMDLERFKELWWQLEYECNL